jgi:hypothetical protein
MLGTPVSLITDRSPSKRKRVADLLDVVSLYTLLPDFLRIETTAQRGKRLMKQCARVRPTAVL